jgi:hypothetical protein
VQEEIDRDLGLFRCAKCERLYDPEELPVYHDSEGWMTGETIRKIMGKMPGVWEKYLERMEIIHFWKDIFKHNIAIKEQLSLHNFLEYLKDHLDDWTYVECGYLIKCTNISEYLVGYCQKNNNCDKKIPCHGTGKIVIPRFAEAVEIIRRYLDGCI